MLNITNLNVAYGAIRTVWDLSLNVGDGEVVSIVGSNGAGKSTVLKTIAGIVKALSGDIEFKGVKITQEPPHKRVERGISYVPEGRKIFAPLTVLENLELGAYTKKAREKFDDSLEWVYQLFPRLKERTGQMAGSLSGGEQQMLAIGRALMSRPSFLMLDEPSLGLAPAVVKTLMGTIKKLNDEGVTILLVEQNVYYSLKVSHRAYVLEKGKVSLSGKSDELLNNRDIKKLYLGG